MPAVTEADFLKPTGYSIWLNGAAGSGKTRAACGFPDLMAITFDPTGLDILREPENAALRANIRYHVPLNGLPLSEVFAFTETPGESGIYAAIALAKQLATSGKIKTLLIDGFTYLAQLKWALICENKGIDPLKKEEVAKRDVDQRGMYDALGSYLDHLVLQNLLPLSGRYGLNVIVTCHLQRESDNTVAGVKDSRNPELERSSKRLVNLGSDLSPQIVGGFRQRVEGLPSALIYLEHKLEEKDGKEVISYYAYCKMVRSTTLDTLIKSKNRYGLPAVLRLTDASFYKTLISKLEQSKIAVQPQTTAAKAATNTKET